MGFSQVAACGFLIMVVTLVTEHELQGACFVRGEHFLGLWSVKCYWGYFRDCACSPQLAGLGLRGLCGEPQFPYPNAEGVAGAVQASGQLAWAFR